MNEQHSDDYTDVDWTIGKFWTIFQNLETEQQFRDSRLTVDANLVAVVCIGMAILMLLGITTDIKSFSGSLFQQLLISRLLVVTFCFTLASILFFRPSIARINYFPLALMTVVVLGFSFVSVQWVQASVTSYNLQLFPILFG